MSASKNRTVDINMQAHASMVLLFLTFASDTTFQALLRLQKTPDIAYCLSVTLQLLAFTVKYGRICNLHHPVTFGLGSGPGIFIFISKILVAVHPAVFQKRFINIFSLVDGFLNHFE